MQVPCPRRRNLELSIQPDHLTSMAGPVIQTPTWLRHMESILEELNEGVIIVDDQLRVIFANEALCLLAEDISDYVGRWKTIVCRWHDPGGFQGDGKHSHLERRHYRQSRARRRSPNRKSINIRAVLSF